MYIYNIVTHKLKKTKERTVRKIIIQSNTDIWIYKIEALEQSIQMSSMINWTSSMFRLSQTFPPSLTSIMSFKTVTLD